MEKLIVFTDGSCLHNGKINACGGYAIVWPNFPQFTCQYKLKGELQTNNRAEFMAVIQAIQTANKIDPLGIQPLCIYTDSQLVIKSCTLWLPTWKKNGWKTSQKKQVVNLDLVKQLDQLLQNCRPIEFIYVKAHTNGQDFESRYNELADRMAKEACFS